jgi:hypothetical protein
MEKEMPEHMTGDLIMNPVEYLGWVTKEWQGDHQTYYSFGIMLGDKLINSCVAIVQLVRLKCHYTPPYS